MARKSQVIAITHTPSPKMQGCRRTYADETAIDCDLARRQHAGYCAVLEECGAEVISLTENVDGTDCALIEDAGTVLDEIAAVGAMAAESRRGESAAVAAEQRKCRSISKIALPA